MGWSLGMHVIVLLPPFKPLRLVSQTLLLWPNAKAPEVFCIASSF
jgi:hypothetical protein